MLFLRFQSTYLYKVRLKGRKRKRRQGSFNPRTYIRYDFLPSCTVTFSVQFQSTYLYKVRLVSKDFLLTRIKFQSTYLYKVRLLFSLSLPCHKVFQSTYLYKVRRSRAIITGSQHSFNPRTYIRYDCITNNANIYSLLSMHLCDNKLFGFFIDEIKLIGVFNRLIINDCENSSFLLMLNVRKQLYYKFIFYIIGCDDTYVFNSFRIIISQEIETNTIFFMIDDIR